MKFQHVTISSPFDASVELLAVCVSPDPLKDALVRQLNTKLGGALVELCRRERFTGQQGQAAVMQNSSGIAASFVALLGAGDAESVRVPDVRQLAGEAARLARCHGAKSLAFVPPRLPPGDRDLVVQFAVEGALLGEYRFDKYRGKEIRDPRHVAAVQIFTELQRGKAKANASRAAIRRGRIVADAISRARDLVNEPPASLTPARFAERARAMVRKYPSIRIKVFRQKECERLNMGMFLAVARGSDEEPRLVHLAYSPKRKAKKRVALIGKCVTFDSGGYSLKPSSQMEDMKTDMAGAAAVVTALGAIAQLESDCEVHAVTPCCENLVSGRAYKLGDVLTSMEGTTVEINNTDAEGRLTLGDALHYARTRIKPDEMFDFATLTGACVVALGPYIAGVLSPNADLAAKWLRAAQRAGEEMWQLPLSERLKEQLKSNMADLRNTGERWGGAITAALFLRHFVKETPWVHIDLAGPASATRDYGAVVRGGTGFGVATIVEYLTGKP